MKGEILKIWVDADACPNAIKEIIYKASARTRTPVVLVANKWLATPRQFPLVSFIKVEQGADVADAYIVDQISAIDLVITADIPLADLVVQKGATAIDPRGDHYTPETIKERLSIRNFMQELRSSSDEIKGGPAPFNEAAKKRFADSLDRVLAKKNAR